MSIVTEIRHTVICDKCGVQYVEWTVPREPYRMWSSQIPSVKLPALWFNHAGALYCDKHVLAVNEA